MKTYSSWTYLSAHFEIFVIHSKDYNKHFNPRKNNFEEVQFL